MSVFSIREKFASCGLILYVVGFFACMFMDTMDPIYYTLVTLFTMGQIIFLIPCVMALLDSFSPLLHPETVFLFGFNILLFAPQAYMLPAHAHFVHMFATLSATGSVISLASFFFIDIFRTRKDDSIVDLEDRKDGIKHLWRIVDIPKGIKNGEFLRLTVFLGLCLGILGSHLYAFVSIKGGAITVLMSSFVTSIGLYAGRTNWFVNRGRSDSFSSSNSFYGSIN